MPSGHRITAAGYAPMRLHSPCKTTVTRTVSFRYWPPIALGTRWTNCLAAACFCRLLWARGRGRNHDMRIAIPELRQRQR
jgi:hypothetical protein